jgi:hypothetical protein
MIFCFGINNDVACSSLLSRLVVWYKMYNGEWGQIEKIYFDIGSKLISKHCNFVESSFITHNINERTISIYETATYLSHLSFGWNVQAYISDK